MLRLLLERVITCPLYVTEQALEAHASIKCRSAQYLHCLLDRADRCASGERAADHDAICRAWPDFALFGDSHHVSVGKARDGKLVFNLANELTDVDIIASPF